MHKIVQKSTLNDEFLFHKLLCEVGHIKIAICDDEQIIVDEIMHTISDYALKKNIKIYIDCFTSGKELLKNPNHYDLVFLDIEMNDSNGIEVAADLKNHTYDTKIVFVTNFNSYWSKAFCVHAFDYIVKPVNAVSLIKVIDDFLRLTSNSKDKYIICKSDSGIRFINQDNLYYLIVEARNKICLYTKYGNIIINSNLQDIYNKLDKEFFFKTRRDCIINLKYVNGLKNDCVIQMTNGDIVPIAQRKKKDFIDSLSYLISNITGGARYDDYV